MTLYLGHMSSLPCIAAKPSEKYLGPWPTMGAPSQHSNLHMTSGQDATYLSGKKASKLQQRKGSHRRGVSSSSHEPCPTPCHCKFFLWNFISYYKYKQTMLQSQQNTFEGRGGKKFVRIQPNTILERWYPQLREGQLKTDACFLCGYSWKDHLEYWWHCRRRQGGVSAFDHYMEKSAVDRGDKFAFHKKYVDEIDSSKRRYHGKGQEVRKTFDGEASYSYLVPPFDPLLADGRPKSIGSVLLLALARTSSLVRIEELMWLSTVESSRSRQEL